MVSYCDFTEQTSTRDGEGKLLRPDMVVRLPNERVIAVDAKTNTYAYLEAVNARDAAEREQHLDRFATHVYDQAKKLSDKRYWAQFEGSPEFVVMFVPGDHFIDAALARRSDLIEIAAQHNVILASPSTLIGLLRAVAVGWREHRLAEEAQALLRLGAELHERAATTFEHARKLGDALKTSVERYNSMAGSIDQRIRPTLRKFEEAGAKSGKSLAELPEVEVQARLLQSGES
jgi:DNA recombination protein RmuC